MKRWHYERAHGLTRTTQAAPVAAHLQELLNAGWSLRSIADAADYSPSSVHRIVIGVQQRIRNDIAARLAAVDGAAILARQNSLGFVRNLGARRRIQALLAIGWRHEEITATMLQTQPECGTRSQMVLHQRGNWIARRTHDAVAAAYDQLSMTPGPSAKTRRLAAKYGYAPPLAWDDASIDDPDAQPDRGADDQAVLDEVLIERLIAGYARAEPKAGVRPAPEVVEAVVRLHTRGLSDREIGDRIGYTASGVQVMRHRVDQQPERVTERAETDRTIDAIAGWANHSEGADSALSEDARIA
jgi:AraC-like DNA-binding protein